MIVFLEKIYEHETYEHVGPASLTSHFSTHTDLVTLIKTAAFNNKTSHSRIKMHGNN